MTAKLPDDQIQRIVQLRRDGRSYRDIGSELGINAATAMRYAKQMLGVEASQCGETNRPGPAGPINQPVDDRGPNGGDVSIVTPDKPRTLAEMMELFGIDGKSWVVTNFRANEWQGFYKIKNRVGDVETTGHQKVRLYQTRLTLKRIVAEEIEHAILKFTKEHVKALPTRKKKGRSPHDYPQMVSWGLWDAHLGMYAFRGEVGADYDVGIATNRVLNSIDDMVEELRAYPIEKILMPIGNDFLHFDSVRHTTTFGDNFLDTDTRYGHIYLAGLRCLAYMVERATEICDDIELIYVPGNHDLGTSYGLTVALSQRYRNDERVTADLSFNPRKYRKFGRTLLGYEHGQKCKAAQLALIMHEEARDLLAGVVWKEWQVGHTHQRQEKWFQGVEPTNSVLIRTNPCLCNVDSWHHNQGFISEPTKSVEAWRYRKDTGYVGSHVAWARDDQPGEAARSFLL